MVSRTTPQDPTPKHITALLPEVLRQVGRQHAELETIRHRWKQLVGRELAAHCFPVSVRRKHLVIAVPQPGDRFTLEYRKERLKEQLEKLTQGKVTGVILRPGDQPHAIPH